MAAGVEAAALVGREVFWEVVDRGFPVRGVVTLLGTFSCAEPDDLRVVPRAGARVERVPVAGTEPSARRWSWWSELIHLTSVGGHCGGAPGERSGAHVNTS